MREFLQMFEVSASALTAQRWRMNVLSSNMANAETTRTPEGGPYRRQDVVFSVTRPSFQDLLQGRSNPYVKGVRVVEVAEDPRPLQRAYNPSHPDADAEGYITMPNVHPLEEMVNMMAAARSYEANVEVFNATKMMLLKALEIGKV